MCPENWCRTCAPRLALRASQNPIHDKHGTNISGETELDPVCRLPLPVEGIDSPPPEHDIYMSSAGLPQFDHPLAFRADSFPSRDGSSLPGVGLLPSEHNPSERPSGDNSSLDRRSKNYLPPSFHFHYTEAFTEYVTGAKHLDDLYR